MFLFKTYKISLNNLCLLPWSKLATPVMSRKRTLFEVLTGEENSHSIGSLLFILVLLVHLWVALWLLQPVKFVTLAKPLIMEVSLVSPGQPASTPPPAAAKPATPKPVTPVQQKKRPVKKPLRKKMPVKQKNAALPKPETATEERKITKSYTDFIAGSDAKPLGKISGAPASATGTLVKNQPFIEARVNANYGSNPKPEYPSLALNRGWVGKVLLQVRVTADGLSEAVTVHRSSGHQILDESAVTAVQNWRFIPARRGNSTVASSVIVPIVFNLNN